jgi:hypothetical protein
MLRTNLATRPFYNDQAVRLAIGVGFAVIAALTLFNMARIVTLNRRNAELVASAEAGESRANALREQARKVRETLDSSDAALIQASAREANLLIERRAFSWTELFNRLEETLPADVRVGAVQPQIDTNGRMLIVATVYSRRIERLAKYCRVKTIGKRMARCVRSYRATITRSVRPSPRHQRLIHRKRRPPTVHRARQRPPEARDETELRRRRRAVVTRPP